MVRSDPAETHHTQGGPHAHSRLRSVLFLVLIVAVLAAAAAGLGGAGKTPAAQAGPAAATAHWCNFVLAGKNATADGSVLMGYNNDWSANNYVYLQAVPGDATHNKYVKLYTWGGVPEGGINEHQLGALYGTATDLDKSVLAADPYVKKGYGGEIWDLILQQCTTAQQAITLLGQMAQTGFNSGAAGSFAVGDPNQVWLFELLGGHHWVAQRVPDNAFLAHPNMVTVRQINLADAANYRGSADLQSFAQSIGRYSPSDGPFDVAWAYGDRTDLQSYYNTNRLWGAFNTVAPSLGLTPTMTYATRPVYVVPDHTVTRQEIQTICRYHYEGTSIDQTQNYALMSPHAQTNRPICYSTTDYSAVWQLRSLEARRHRRRHVGRALPAVLERLRAVLRLDHECPDRLDEQDRLQPVPRRRRQPGQERDRGRRAPLQALHPAGEEHVRGVRDGVHERAGEHRDHGRRPERRRPHHVPDQLLVAARDAGSEPGRGAAGADAVSEANETLRLLDARCSTRAYVRRRSPTRRSRPSCTRRCARRRPAT